MSALLADAQDDWWLIGSAAVWLHGSDPGGIADIDVVLSERDAEQLLEPRGILPQTLPPHELFHSRWFARWEGTPVPVEFMAGFSIMEDGEWKPVLPASREGKNGLFVPSREELKSLLHRFGRGKDLQRAAAL